MALNDICRCLVYIAQRMKAEGRLVIDYADKNGTLMLMFFDDNLMILGSGNTDNLS